MNTSNFDRLQRESLYRPYAFDRVTISSSAGEVISLLGKCYSEFRGGPSLFDLADTAAELLGPGYYGLSSSRFLGWREL